MRRTAVALLSLTLLTGCGGGDGGTQALKTSPVDVLRAAAGTTAKAGSSKISLTSETAAAGQTFTFGGDGVFAYGGEPKGQLTLNGKVGGITFTVAMRLLDGTAYLQLPGKPGWYAAKTADLAGTSFGSQADPTQGLEYLNGVGGDVKEVGKETVRGDETTHYTGSIDVEKLLSVLKGKAHDTAEKAFSTSDVTNVPFDAYVDKEGRVRKVVEKITLKVQGQTATSTTTAEYYDFGTKVDVVAPPAAEVHDGTAVLKTFG